jgi:hypothetical protein
MQRLLSGKWARRLPGDGQAPASIASARREMRSRGFNQNLWAFPKFGGGDVSKANETRIVSMRNSILLLVFCLCCMFSHQGLGNSENQEDLESIVKDLGKFNLPDQQFEKLREDPLKGARLLTEELRVIHETRIVNWEHDAHKEAIHVIWCIRALRYITGGLDFRARTAHEFGNSEIEQRRKYWLNLGREDGELPFFAVWPSRDSLYVAPKDAQKAIIAKWLEWYREEAATFEFNPLRKDNPEEWYF